MLRLVVCGLASWPTVFSQDLITSGVGCFCEHSKLGIILVVTPSDLIKDFILNLSGLFSHLRGDRADIIGIVIDEQRIQVDDFALNYLHQVWDRGVIVKKAALHDSKPGQGFLMPPYLRPIPSCKVVQGTDSG